MKKEKREKNKVSGKQFVLPACFFSKMITQCLTIKPKETNMSKESIISLRKKLDLPHLLDQMNAALSEEWLAYYQYWIGAQVVEGYMRTEVQKEFEEHAREEAKHIEWLSKRIIALEGVPVLDPRQWTELSRCKYEAPTQPDVLNLLHQNIRAERCAIMRYIEIIRETEGIDFTTCDIAKRILAEEEEHEQELFDFLNDVRYMKEYVEARLEPVG